MKIISPKEALQDRYKPVNPKDTSFRNFSDALDTFKLRTDEDGLEASNTTRITKFLQSIFYGDNKRYEVVPLDNDKKKVDLAITRDNQPIVLIEVKKPSEKNDMVTQKDFNKKAFHELILYFLREIDPKEGTSNNDIANIIITNNNEWFIIDAQDFRHIANIKDIRNKYQTIDKEKTATFPTTDEFYTAVKKILNKDENRIKLGKLKAVYINFKQNYTQREKISIYKLFTPRHLLKEFGANNSNTLNKKFYDELLHIMGLEEVGEGTKLIQRKPKNTRDNGSLLENTIRKLTTEFNIIDEKVLFEKALELNITWLNRLLFLKLLDSHLNSIHGGTYNKFLDTRSIANYDVLNTLFFEVLAIRADEREKDIVNQFRSIPYLNSSLFEPTKLERDTLRISGLKDDVTMNVLSSTKTELDKDKPYNTLNYLITFLNSYNFSSDASKILDDEKGSLINASVLGLIFEKINGYKDGSFFTPSFITMYMTKESIRKSVVAKFNEAHNINAESIEAVKRYLRKANLDFNEKDIRQSNDIINQITVLDPAVGSGHFLVSVLNELFVIKSELGLIKGLESYTVTNADDELLIFNTENENLFEYNANESGIIPKEKQKKQKIIFQEKQRIIENQLFGVDINPNSVKITRLRLWIELLKHSYYENGELITLPNIDINIKCGNSLVSRFPLKDNDTKNKLLKAKLNNYKKLVIEYKSETNKGDKHDIEEKINDIKNGFKEGLHEFSPTMIKFKKALKEYVSIHKYDGLLEELILTAVKNNLGVQQAFFDDEVVIRKAKEQTKEKMLRKLNKQYQTIKEFENNEIYKNSFEWRFEFPEVLNEDGDFEGFDIVIGNPPYLPLEAYSERYRAFFKKKYTNLIKKYDSSAMFFEEGFKILKKNGTIAYIAPITWQTGENYSLFRKNIISNHSIQKIINLPFNIFLEAYIDTAIYILNKSPKYNFYEIYNFNKKDKVTSLDNIEFDKIFIKTIDETKYKLILNESFQKILNKINTIETLKLGSISYSTQGLSGSKFEESKDGDLFPFLKDGNAYNFTLIINEVFFTDMNQHKNLKRFYDEREKILIRRIVNRQDKLTVGYTNQKMVFKKDINPFIVHDDNFHTKYILGLLSSSLISWIYINMSSIALKNDFRQTTLTELRSLPIPKITKEEQQPYINIVDEIITLKKENKDTKILERQLDDMVYGLYGLTSEEIDIIDPERNNLTNQT